MTLELPAEACGARPRQIRAIIFPPSAGSGQILDVTIANLNERASRPAADSPYRPATCLPPRSRILI